MKKLSLFLFGIILSIGLFAQIPGNPNASGVITPGPPDFVTGLPVGDGEMKLQLQYQDQRNDSLTNFIDPSDSTAYFNYIMVEDSLIVNDSTFVVNGTTHRVGINKAFPETTLDVQVDTNTYAGIRVRNLSDGVLASGGASFRNDNDRLTGIGISGSNNALFGSDVGVLVHSGYNDMRYIVDGNYSHTWWTDVTDTHFFVWTKKMELTAGGTLLVDTITTDSITVNAIEYADTYWDDLRVPLTNTKINPVNTEPDFEDRGDGLFAWGFDADNDSSYVLNFTAQGSHSRKDSTDQESHFHWQPDGTDTGNVLWRLIYSMANIGSDWTPIDTLWALDAADGVALKHQVIDFGMLVGSDTMRISHAIVGNVCRVGEDARDTYTGTAFGIELDFHYQIDRPGSHLIPC